MGRAEIMAEIYEILEFGWAISAWCDCSTSCMHVVSVVPVVPVRARPCPSVRSPPVPRNSFPCEKRRGTLGPDVGHMYMTHEPRLFVV